MNSNVNYHETYLYKFRTFSSLFERVLDNTLRKHMGVTLSQLMLLMTASQQTGVNQRQIASHLGLSPAAIKRQLDIAKQKNYITIIEHAGRGDKLYITDTGEEVLLQCLDILDRSAFQVFDHHNKSTSLMQHLDYLLNETKTIINQENTLDNIRKPGYKENSNYRH